MSDICSAIDNLQLVSFSYHGYPRVVEPHTFGVDSRDHYALRAYQVRGGSRSGRVPDWRFFHSAEMFSVTVLSESFSGARLGYKKDDKAFATIRCQL